MSALEIYVLNVGQGDTAIIKTPRNNVMVIDAVKPPKVKDALDSISPGRTISHLIVTLPHKDHYRAVSSLLAEYQVQNVILAPFWHYDGTPQYHTTINRIEGNHIPVRFVGGYERIYPDAGTYPYHRRTLHLEVLGPPNDILEELEENDDLNPNHLSIIARLRYGKFSMVFAADAQMENWTHYDRAGMLEEECSVLKAAHHGSRRGTQWERLERLSPELVIVSSDPTLGDELPDLIGSAILLEYDDDDNRTVALTSETGTIKITVDDARSARYTPLCFREPRGDSISGRQPESLRQTNWRSVVQSKIPP